MAQERQNLGLLHPDDIIAAFLVLKLMRLVVRRNVVIVVGDNLLEIDR